MTADAAPPPPSFPRKRESIAPTPSIPELHVLVGSLREMLQAHEDFFCEECILGLRVDVDAIRDAIAVIEARIRELAAA